MKTKKIKTGGKVVSGVEVADGEKFMTCGYCSKRKEVNLSKKVEKGLENVDDK